MNTLPLRTFVRIACLLGALGWPLAAAAGSVKATINGMVCAFCAQGIEKRLQKLPETGAIHVDLKRKLVVVEPKSGSTLDESRIRTEIREAGYEVVALEPLAMSVEEFRRAAKADK
jgi:mercuric ion binding protein